VQKALIRSAEIINNKQTLFGRLFANVTAREEAPFLGDSWLMKELEKLCSFETPLIRRNYTEGKTWDLKTGYELTDAGHDVLKCKINIRDIASVDFWRGGVHITNDNFYMWDEAGFCLVNKN